MGLNKKLLRAIGMFCKIRDFVMGDAPTFAETDLPPWWLKYQNYLHVMTSSRDVCDCSAK